MAEGYTREAFALHLMELIAKSEQKQLAAADRVYTLDLARDVLAAVDGKRPFPMKIAGAQ